MGCRRANVNSQFDMDDETSRVIAMSMRSVVHDAHWPGAEARLSEHYCPPRCCQASHRSIRREAGNRHGIGGPSSSVRSGLDLDQVNGSGTGFKIRFAEIAGVAVQPDSQFRAAFGAGELYVDVVAVNCLFKDLDRPVGAEPGLDRMISFTQAVDQALLTRPVGIRGRRRRRRILRHLFHFLSEAQWPHISPDFLDQRQAVGFRAYLADAFPTKRNFLVFRPNRVLLLVIDYYPVYSGVFSIGIMPGHSSSPPIQVCKL